MSNWYGWIALQQRREDGGKWRVLHHSGYCAATFDDKASAKAEAQRLNDAESTPEDAR
jgi:hypothetical protein